MGSRWICQHGPKDKARKPPWAQRADGGRSRENPWDRKLDGLPELAVRYKDQVAESRANEKGAPVMGAPISGCDPFAFYQMGSWSRCLHSKTADSAPSTRAGTAEGPRMTKCASAAPIIVITNRPAPKT